MPLRWAPVWQVTWCREWACHANPPASTRSGRPHENSILVHAWAGCILAFVVMGQIQNWTDEFQLRTGVIVSMFAPEN